MAAPRRRSIDPLWYKDAVIYETARPLVLRLRTGTASAICAGVTEKLDYLQELGITCLWLLPFFPSPLKDDGYDISDYRSIHPDYGTVEDFRQLLEAAHARGIQVMIELVVNHTSDQHPWFQAARRRRPARRSATTTSGATPRSDTATPASSSRTRRSPTGPGIPWPRQYYWHRFFSHQPDLNFENPAVLQEVLEVLRFWLDMGVDGFRLDAVPYLAERDGTNCENLPETHAIIRRDAAVDGCELTANRMLLAEANQWPTDVRPYFGDGDECHMAFHFPLMPRIFMALRLEDRLADDGDHAADARPFPTLANGRCSCATTTS